MLYTLMPSEHIVTVPISNVHVQSDDQVKCCSVCQSQLEKDGLIDICMACRRDIASVSEDTPCGDASEDQRTDSPSSQDNPVFEDAFLDSEPEETRPHVQQPSSPCPPPTRLQKKPLPIDTRTGGTPDGCGPDSAGPRSNSSERHGSWLDSRSPDPHADITRLRMRSQAHHCLYPGSQFRGEQKSGKTSYQVTVTICVRPTSL